MLTRVRGRRYISPSLYSLEDIDRFLSKVDFFPEEHPECWIWTAACDSNDYGKFSIQNRAWMAHRVSYLIFVGPIQDDVLHSCDTPPCVNPYHLRLGTQLNNMVEMADKGRQWKQSGL